MSGNTSLVSERRVLLTNDVGLHARPAARFVRTAARFRSVVKVMKGENAANAKSITSILFLDAKKGDEITIRVEGEDSALALEALVELVKAF